MKDEKKQQFDTTKFAIASDDFAFTVRVLDKSGRVVSSMIGSGWRVEVKDELGSRYIAMQANSKVGD